ncbi:MAG: Yip1 family protein [Hyphomonadaceae bacterium]
MTIEPGAAAAGLVDRAKNILLTPQAEWDRIAGEPADTNKLYTGYVLPLVALAAICGFIGMTFIGASAFGVSVRIPMMAGLVSAIMQVVMGVVGIYVMALIINALAPNFGSQQDVGQAHKLSAYSATAGLLAGVLALLPPLSMLSILGGIYSLVLLYIGMPRLMKTPEDKRIGYLITVIVVSIVLWFALAFVLGSVTRFVPGAAMGGAGGFTIGQSQRTQPEVSGQVTLPGGGSVDLDAMRRQAEAMQNGAAMASADPGALQQRLPQALPGGFTLTSTSSGSAMGTAQATAEYNSGGARIELTIVHMGAMGAMAGMAAGMNVQQNRQDANGYERTQTVNGRVVTESVDNASRTAHYGIVGRGVAVNADGSGGATIEQVRAAVEAAGLERLEREFGG